MTVTTFADRLKLAVAQRERELGERILKKDIATAAGVTSSAVTLWFKGTTHDVRADPIMRLAKFLRVRVEWLKDGRGPMREGDAHREAILLVDEHQPVAPVSKDAQALIELITERDRNGSLTKEMTRAFRVLLTAYPTSAPPSKSPLEEAESLVEQQIAAKQPKPRKRKTVA